MGRTALATVAFPVLIDHRMRTTQVGRELERLSGPTFHVKGSLDEVI